jgi:hypothetical protein
MEPEEFGLLDIPQGADVWSYLPQDLLCKAISGVTDISDISQAFQTSNTFRQYASSCIQSLTSDKIVTVSLQFLSTFPNIIIANHNIVFTVSEDNLHILRKLNKLQQASLLIDDNLLEPLLQNLNGLNLSHNYFKILLTRPETIVGVLILDNNFLIIPWNYEEWITEKINQINPNLIPVELPDPQTRIIPREEPVFGQNPFGPNIPQAVAYGPSLTGYRLWKNPMREFLLTSDFGLLDPTQEPSEENKPLSEYIRLIADGCNANLLTKILSLYVNYHMLMNGILINADQRMRHYFGEQLKMYKPDINLSAMLMSNFTSTVRLNSLNSSLTIKDIVEYNFPSYIPSAKEITEITNRVNFAKNRYRTLGNQARHNQGVTFYATDGTLRHLS